MIFLLLAAIALVALHIPRTVPVPGLRTRRQRGATIAGIVFVLAGALHFIAPEQYQPMMPPALPFPLALIYVSGVCEMLGGVGLIVPRTRRWAAWGLIALLIAVFPANVYVAYAEVQMPAFPHAPAWAYWARLPFQAVFIAWWHGPAAYGPTPRSGPESQREPWHGAEVCAQGLASCLLADPL